MKLVHQDIPKKDYIVNIMIKKSIFIDFFLYHNILKMKKNMKNNKNDNTNKLNLVNTIKQINN